jgi:uncharacterized protein (TIGR03382 family)
LTGGVKFGILGRISGVLSLSGGVVAYVANPPWMAWAPGDLGRTRRFITGEVASTVHAQPDRAVLRYLLGGLLAFGTVNAVGGGLYGLAGAEGVPIEWLEGSPFRDYFIPSLILMTVVGGTLLLASIAVFANMRVARMAAFFAAIVVLGWITVQVVIIGYVSFMQPATAIGALLILALAWLLPRRRPPGERSGRS